MEYKYSRRSILNCVQTRRGAKLTSGGSARRVQRDEKEEEEEEGVERAAPDHVWEEEQRAASPRGNRRGAAADANGGEATGGRFNSTRALPLAPFTSPGSTELNNDMSTQ